jgi:uncharacterized cupredoxin-like copper-binding protein
MLKKVVLLAAATAAIGCTAKEAPKVDSAALAAAAPATPNVVTITAKDFAFEAPDSIPSGMTTLVLKNTGTTLHHAQLLRLKEGKTLADLQAGMKNMKPTDPMPPWIEEAGGVNVPEPGAETSATLMIEPGNYVLLCFVDTPDKVPHVMKGMIKGLTVTPSTKPSAPAPTADVTVTLSDYTFAFSTPLTAGRHTVKIENSATQHHEFVLFQLLPGKTMDDFAKWGATYKGPAPAKAMGGAPGIAPGQSQYVSLDLTPGDYVVICFLPDAKDGKPHMQHGMVMPIKVQ